MDVGDRVAVPTDWGTGGRRPCGKRFQGWVHRLRQRRVYLRLYRERCACGYGWSGRERKAENHRDAYSIQRGNCSTDTAYQGELLSSPATAWGLNDVLGDQTRFLTKGGARTSLCADDDCAENGSKENGCWCFTQLADDPLCVAKWFHHHEITFFLAGCLRLFPLAVGKYSLKQWVKEPSVIYMERLLKVTATPSISSAAQPFWASIGLSVTPLAWLRCHESRVSLGYLNQSFQNAVRGWCRYGLEQGLFGWNVTDRKICFEYGFITVRSARRRISRSLALIVLEQALKESGRSCWNLISFIPMRPEYLPGAYHDAMHQPPSNGPGKKGWSCLWWRIARCIQAYRTDLAFSPTAERMPYRAERDIRPLSASRSSSPLSKQPPGTRCAICFVEGNVQDT